MTDEIKDPLLGQTLGVYQIVEPLGKGGMATVYKAYESALDRHVAVKILPQSLSADQNFIQRFCREAKVVAQLNHPNIVPIYSFGEERNITYIAMQLVDGGTLRHEPGQAFALQDALRLLTPIVRALGYAHQRGIIHRDIKPSNILLAGKDWPMLADFGLARTTGPSGNLTGTGTSIGTPLYMSPEQAQGVNVDHRTDIYSLGIVLYEMVTGDVPFRADTPMGIVIKHITDPIPRPRNINPQITEDIELIILKATTKDPASRYQTAQEMADAMESALTVLTAAPQVTIQAPAVKALEKPASGNPFTFGNPIKDPDRFFGRTAEIRQIVNRLLSSAHESTSIIGERRIGKTSLLYHLASPEVSSGLGLTSDKFCLVYVDFQGLTDITPQRFWQRVLKKMERSICDQSLIPSIQKLSAQSDFDLFDLEDLFESSQDKGLTIVLLMDEFEYVTQNPNFRGDFFGGLRALAIHHGVALIPATRRELVDLCHSDEIKGSPFFNIFANVVLRPFSRTEVDELLEGYTKDNEFALMPQEKDFIWELGGGYPIFVQMAGHYLLEGRAQGLSSDALTKFTVDTFNQQADAHYTYLWSHCSESEKITLLTLLTLSMQKPSKKTIPSLENLTRVRARTPQDLVALGKRGMVVERDGAYRLFSPTLERWIRQEIVAAPGEEETQTTAEEWLKSGRHEDLKTGKGILPKFKKKYWHMLGDITKELSLEFAVAGAFELIKVLV